MKSRILYIVGQLRAGGLERQLYYLLGAMDRNRYMPAIAVWNYRDNDPYVAQIRSLGVPLYSLPSEASGVRKLMAFCDLVRRMKPQVIHSYTFYTNFAAWFATRNSEALAIGAVRSEFKWIKSYVGPVLGRISARWPREQICNSFHAALSVQSSRSPFSPKRVTVVRNGMDLDSFKCVPLTLRGAVRIFCVGSLVPEKRWDRLITVAAELKRQGHTFQVEMIGDGPLYGSLRQLARDLAVDDRIRFAGYMDDVHFQLRNATFLVHTSDTEGCPNVVMEAMACGRAVVATDSGDIPYLVEDGRTGFVVRRGDARGLAERVATLIADRGLCQRMGESARIKAEQEFSLDRLVSETLAVYQAGGWKDS